LNGDRLAQAFIYYNVHVIVYMSKTATANTNQPDKIILTEMFI